GAGGRGGGRGRGRFGDLTGRRREVIEHLVGGRILRGAPRAGGALELRQAADDGRAARPRPPAARAGGLVTGLGAGGRLPALRVRARAGGPAAIGAAGRGLA